jgi:hypothetical protein
MRRAGTMVTTVGCGVLLCCGCYQSRAEGDGGTDEGDVSTCGLDMAITFGYQGGWTRFDQSYALAVDGTFVATRTEHDGTRTSCTTRIPPCDAADALVVDLGDVASMFHRSGVVAALASSTPPLYGYDSRPVDGSVFAVTRADGRGFLVGDPCDSHSPCTPIPPDVAGLAGILRELIDQELARPECSALR